MTVARILKEKGQDVQTVQPHHTLKAVIDRLAEKRIGALVVTDATRSVLGIISERDIVRVLSEVGAEALDHPVSKHMTRSVETVGEETSIDRLMAIMTNGRFRHLPVVEDDELIGIVSVGDVVRRQLDLLNHESEQLRQYIGAP